MRLDEKDKEILKLIQKNAKLRAKEIARKINSPITTVFAKIKRMEEEGIIKSYNALLDAKLLGFETLAFIFVSFSKSEGITQEETAKEIAKFPEVQEVHIISGEWDILVKVRGRNTEEIGKFVVEKLRSIKGIEKTLTSVVFMTAKETLSVPII